MTAPVLAQGVDRYSVAGESAAEATHGSSEPSSYNLQVGQASLKFDAGTDISYNDNLNLSNTDRQSAVVVTPSLNMHGAWQATELNALTFDLGVSYEHYFGHSYDDSFQIAPGSQTQFSIFVGDFKITFHDGLSYQQDPTEAGQVSNVSKFDQFINDAGVNVAWNVSDISFSLGYDHSNFWSFQSQFSYLDYQSDSISPTFTLILSPTIQTGIDTSFSLMRYQQHFQNDSREVEATAFISATITEYLSVQAAGGWEFSDYDSGGLNGDNTNINSPIASVGVTHRLNDSLVESLTAGREYIPGITSNYTDRIYAEYSPTWQATSLFSIAPELWWERLEDSGATERETDSRYGLRIGADYLVTSNLSVGINYQYTLKNSSDSTLNYRQNLISIGAHYQF